MSDGLELMYCDIHQYDTSSRWTDCTSTTGTTPTDWYLDYQLIVTRVNDWPSLATDFTPPKWWRWYDVFRTWAKPKLLPLLEGYRQAVRRVQERYPAQQRARRKRRAYVQALHAL